MAGPGLSTSNDSAYGDSATDPSVKKHQQDHDTLAGVVNQFDANLAAAVPGQILAWNGTVYAPADRAAGNSGLVSLTAFNVPLDGTTDATSAMVAAIASGESLYHPGGTALVSADALALNAGQHITGAGSRKSTIRRAGGGTLLNINGGASGNAGHKKYCGLRNLQLHGNDTSGTLLEMVYSGDHVIEGCDFYASYGRAVDGVELWDTRFLNNSFGFTGDYPTDVPCVHIRNARAVSGFGSGTDNSNQIHFIGNRLEAFRNRGLVIEQGSSTNVPNGFYLFGNKIETAELLGPRSIIQISDGVVHVVVDGLYVFVKMGAAATSGALPEIIRWTPARHASIRNVSINTAAGVTQTNGVYAWGSAPVNEISNIDGNYSAAPSGAHVYFAGGTSFTRPVANRTNLGLAEVSGQATIMFPEGRPGLVGAVTSAYTLRLIDHNSRLDSTSGSAITLTVPPDLAVALPVGSRIEVWQYGAGVVTITAGAGVTLRGATLTTSQYGRLTLTKRGANEWYVSP